MIVNKQKIDTSNELQLRRIILQLVESIENGSFTIIKQDNVIIQINTQEKILLDNEYLQAV